MDINLKWIEFALQHYLKTYRASPEVLFEFMRHAPDHNMDTMFEHFNVVCHKQYDNAYDLSAQIVDMAETLQRLENKP